MSSNYVHILLASDLSDDNIIVANRARELAQYYGAKLSILNVVESTPLYIGNELVLPEIQEIESQLMERARKKMQGLAQQLGLAGDDCHVEAGITKMEIMSFIEEQQVDLVVIGRHSRHGLERLLGSTANAVVNKAPCDVLTVNIKK